LAVISLQRYSFFGIRQKIIEKNEKLFGIMRLFSYLCKDFKTKMI